MSSPLEISLMFSRTKVVRFRHLHIGPQDFVKKIRRYSILFFALLLGLAAGAPLYGQLKTTVHVETAKVGPLVYTTSLGVAGVRWDAKAFDAATVKLLKDVGITSLRFPGNNGIAAL